MLARRKNKKTNYRKRLAMLKSGKARLVVRRNGMNVHAQLVQYTESGDRTILEEISKNLLKYGWKGHTTNLPASYLTGFIVGMKAVKKGITEAILDIGLQTSTGRGALYALVKGANDGGLSVPAGKEVLPEADRVSGKHIAEYAAMLKSSDINAYNKQFSGCIKKGMKPEDVQKHFEEVKQKIMSELSGKK